MIATDHVPAATHFRSDPRCGGLGCTFVVLVCVSLLGQGCVSHRPLVPSPKQAELQMRLGDERIRLRDLEREIAALALVAGEQQARADALLARQWETRRQVQARTADLDRELSQLAALEQDLVAARKQSANVKAAIAELDRLQGLMAEHEAAVKDLEKRLVAAAAAREQGMAAVAAKEQEVALEVAAATARITELSRRGAVLMEAFALLRDALPADAREPHGKAGEAPEAKSPAGRK